MMDSTSESTQSKPSEDVTSSTKTRKRYQETKVSNRPNSINSPRDYISLLALNLINLPSSISGVYAVKHNGYGSFCLTYFFLMIVVALPVLYMQMFLGQYSRQPSLLAWKMSPFSYGIFIYIHIFAFLRSSLIGLVGAKILWYFYDGLSSYDRGFPWSTCEPEQNHIKCYNESSDKLSMDCKPEGYHIVCPGGKKYQLAEIQYFVNSFVSDSDLYDIVWPEFVCCAFFWIIVYIFLLKKSFYPKLALVTLVSVSLFITIVFLQVAIRFKSMSAMGDFILIEAAKLSEGSTWCAAFMCAHFALSSHEPSIFAYSTCVHFKTKPDIHALALISIFILLEVLNYATTFGIIGVLASEMNISMDALLLPIPSGTMFCIYPHFLNKLVVGKMWTLLFFVISILSSVVNQVIIISGTLYSVITTYNLHRYRILLATLYCALSFLISMPATLKIGQKLLFQFVRHVFVLGIAIGFTLESIVVFWSYGVTRLKDDVFFMYGSKPSRFWTYTWICTPLLGLSVTFYCFLFSESKESDVRGAYTHYMMGMHTISVLLFCVVVLGAALKIVKHAKKHDLSSLFHPTFDWGPPNKTLRKARKRFHPDIFIPSQPLSTYNTSSVSWRLVREELKRSHLDDADGHTHTEGKKGDKKKPDRQMLFY